MQTPPNDEFPGRLFAIGDVHGCSTALATLLEAISPGPDDTLVFLGDLIDHGPDSRGVIERLMALTGECRVILIRGNHEEMLFDALDGREELERWERSGGLATRANYPGCGDGPILPDHMSFLEARCRDYLETDQFLFVHANYYPNLPMSEQSGRTLRWEFAEPGCMTPHYTGKTAVLGHTTREDGEILDLGFLVMIDTGAWTGGYLTALEVGSGEVIQASQAGALRRPHRRPAGLHGAAPDGGRPRRAGT